MTNERRVLIHADKPALTASVAARFLTKTVDLLDEFEVAHVVLTGGSVGIGVLEAINASSARDTIDWSRMHFWWGDERFVPAGDPERNEGQARAALLDHIAVPAGNVHVMAAADEGLDLDAAAVAYADELRRYAPEGGDWPRFDITFLGVGPDGHVASLFPDRGEVGAKDGAVLPVRDSPKPPPERITLTRGALNSSDRVWLVLAGPDKASALGLGLAGASFHEVPVAGIKGRKRTVFFVDQEAAAEVPENLISSSY
ncbi:6-phosphogluconolactonase [Mycetocola reblochoni]|uniref:6-phosphogluconolactonase n=2 Tax=Mycetocola reblochoni TaxID=331618 RepID=A0A1R4J4Z4_9MICO|nr:6-phosphogluconolactonase [Mycetocola reblochoni]RLP69551.1 6-phosphogluconolactonase [Mycetocola reblochoni]SJN27118.1 6-phosphogluconolactonase, eukaryotic type [Mycetocola reblochoni REB411]